MEKTLVELIMEHLLQQIEDYGETEFKRNQLAEQFNCVPSQISYILETKFKTSKQFIVEVRRGSGGFVRIRQALTEYAPYEMETPTGFIERAYRSGYITKREALIMMTSLSHMEKNEQEKAILAFYKLMRGNEK